MLKSLLPFLLLACSLQASLAQTLPRRAFFGVRMENITDETARVMKLPAVKGVLVNSVVSGSTAEAAGLQRGDVWLQFNGQEINSTEQGMAAVRVLREGQKFTYTYLRAGQEYRTEAVLKPFPREQYADFEIQYDAISANNVLLRTLVTRPKQTGKRPAVLFIQGVGCYSVDSPLDTLRCETQLLNALTRQGFVTMRVDKSGQGDSQGEPCTTLDFDHEAEGYRQALLALFTRPDVDADQVFLIGHSMGGVMAPLIAKDAPVKGIIAYGTIGVNFMEYLLHSRRTIAEANQMSPAEADDYVKMNCECAYPYFVQGKSIAEIHRQQPACREVFGGDLGRPDAFWKQLYALNLPALWTAYDGKVLAAWGQADFISTRAEHVLIADYVNKAHPGNGTFLEVPGCDHGMHGATSFVNAVQDQEKEYNPVVARTMAEWLKKQVGG